MTDYEKLYIKTYYGVFSCPEIARRLNLPENKVKSFIMTNKLKSNGQIEYAVYNGDTFLMTGTKKQLANKMGVFENSITFMTSPTYAKRHANGMRIVNLGKWPIDEELFYKNEEELKKYKGVIECI